ncbi:MAG: four helix bundle protein [Candidatus Omnitrophota bacterium]
MQNAKVFDIKERTLLFSLEIVKFLESFPKTYIADTIGKQLLRSATSIGANIVEAQAAPSKKDFTNFYNISLKSANETKYWLALWGKILRDRNTDIEKLQKEVDEISRILAKSILTIKGR